MKANITLFFGYGIFGLLVGFVVGTTDSEISNTIITILFAFIGGRLFLNLIKRDESIQIKIGTILLAFSLFCLSGIVSGIWLKLKVNEVRREEVRKGGALTKEDSIAVSFQPFLRNDVFVQSIERQYRLGDITCDQAIDSLLRFTSSKKNK